jgi:O-antigen/teichoic acid export membrane protein
MKISSTLKSVLWYQVPFILSSALPLLTLPVFTRYLTINDFGTISLATIYSMFVVGICNLGLKSSFERNYFDEKSYVKKITLFWSCIITVFSGLILAFFSTHIFHKQISNFLFNTILPPYLLLFSLINLGIKSLIQYFFIYFKNSEASSKYARLSIVESLCSTILSIYFVAYESLGIIGYVLGQAIGVCIVFLALVFLFILKKGIAFNIFQLKGALILGVPLIPRTFFGLINGQFDKYMIGIISNTGALGIYDIAQKISYTSFILISSFEKTYSPKIFKLYFEGKKKLRTKAGPFLAPFFHTTFLFCILIGLFSEELLIILTTPDFHFAYPIIIPLTMIYGIYFFGTTGQLLLAGKTKLISGLSFFSLILNILFNFPMIKFYGAIGAAWATFISGLIVSSISFYYFQKHAKIDYPINFIWTILLFLFGLMLTAVFWHFNFNYFSRLILKLLTLITFIFLLYKIKYFVSIKTLLKFSRV